MIDIFVRTVTGIICNFCMHCKRRTYCAPARSQRDSASLQALYSDFNAVVLFEYN